MHLDANFRRRLFGAIVLVVALVMLVVGQTILKNRLTDLGFLLYWLVCFCLTGLAAIVALFDAYALRQRARQQRRDLLEEAIKDIEIEARTRSTKQVPNKKS
jgi:hypothetical protein